MKLLRIRRMSRRCSVRSHRLPSRARKADAADLQKLIDAEAAANHTEKFTLQAWDWPYYAEQLRKQRYCLRSGAGRARTSS